MPVLNGKHLPKEIQLSNYLDNDQESVRVVGLMSGQTLYVDMTLNGDYEHPAKPTAPAWISPDGRREGVHTALLTIAKGNGFAVQFTGKAELQESRGRGLTVANCTAFELHDAYARGARTAGMSFHGCVGFKLFAPVTVDTSNYQTARVDVERWNVSGSIKFEGCRDYDLFQPMSIDHMGNGITATESADGRWIESFTYGVHGANQYINASPGHSVIDGTAVGGGSNRPPGYVVNSEEEFTGVSEGVRVENCYTLDAGVSVGFWGNEGKAGLVIEEAAVVDCVLVGEQGIKVAENVTVANLDRAGTLVLTPGDVPAGVLATLRAQTDRLAALVRKHADLGAIDEQRERVAAGFRALAKPEEPPDVIPLDRKALQAWMAEGAAWLEKGQELVA